MKHNVLVVPDTHAPYHHKHTFEFLREIYKKYRCNEVVHVGDVFDIHRVSRHIPEPESMSIADEIKLGKKFTKALAKLFPSMLVCYGNHDLRAHKQAKEKGIPEEMLVPIYKVFECPDSWTWAYEHQLDGVRYFHGDGYSGEKGALQAAINSRQSVVIGHIHSFGGVLYQNNGSSQVFGLNSGCLIDNSSPAFRYGSTMKNKPTLGCGVVFEGKWAQFVPMVF